MTVDNLLKMNLKELQELKRDDLAREVGRLASAANKRLKRLQTLKMETGIESQAERYVSEHGGKFTVRGKSKDELITEYIRARDFMKVKTSTVHGTKEARQNNLAEIARITTMPIPTLEDIFDDTNLSKSFWGAVDLLRDSDVVEKGSVQLISAVYESATTGRSLLNRYNTELQKAIEEGYSGEDAEEEAIKSVKQKLYKKTKKLIDKANEDRQTDNFGWSTDKVKRENITEAYETANKMLLERGYSYSEARRMADEIVQEAINELEEV